MVRRMMIAAFLGILIAPVNAERLLSVDELRQLAGDADKGHREKGARITGGDLSKLLPEQKTSEGVAEVKQQSKEQSRPEVSSQSKAIIQDTAIQREDEAPRANKYGRTVASAQLDGTHQSGGRVKTNTSRQAPAISVAQNNPFKYVPPPRTESAVNNVYTDAVTVDELEYGIRIGSWVGLKMLKNTSSAEPGVVAFSVTEPVQGRYRVLEAGTELFATKSFNAATKRLEMIISHGVTISGEEFDIFGQVHDAQKVSGLDGIIKKRDIVKGGVQSGVLAATRSVLGQVVKDSPVGVGVAVGADVVLSEGEDTITTQMRDQYVIYVSSQSAKMFVTKTF